jgi:hypothetical protein
MLDDFGKIQGLLDDSNDVGKIQKFLDGMARNLNLSKYLIVENSIRARYPSMKELMAKAEHYRIKCPNKYDCGLCTPLQRNKCWSFLKKSIRLKEIISCVDGFTFEELKALSKGDLLAIARHKKIVVSNQNKSKLIQQLLTRVKK